MAACPGLFFVCVMVASCGQPRGIAPHTGVASPCTYPRIVRRHTQRYALGGTEVTHSGVDFSVCSGEHVVAIADGVVEAVRTADEIWQAENRSLWSRWTSVPTADPPTG